MQKATDVYGMNKPDRCYYCNEPADTYCEDCGKSTCDKHASRDKHPCDDSVPGCHSIWKYKAQKDVKA